VNYYQRHLGDYAKDAGHLSMLEHGCYTLLLDRLYSTEAAIPGADVYRVTRARSKEEKNCVDAVLMEFFILNGDGWINRRAMSEIEDAQTRIAAAKSNGIKGGRPKKAASTETHWVNSGSSLVNPDETGMKALHAPCSKLQSPDEKKEREAPASPEATLLPGLPADLVRDYLAVRKAKKCKLTATAVAGLEREAAKAGLTLEQAVRVCCERSWAGFTLDWYINAGGAVASATPTRRLKELA